MNYCRIFFAVLFIRAAMSVSAQGISDIKISMVLTDQTRYSILRQIAMDHNLHFYYKKDEIKDKAFKQLNFQNQSLREVLIILFEDEEIHFDIRENRSVVIKPIGQSFVASTDPMRFDFTLKGQIVDRESYETLPFATVRLDGTTRGVSTNVDGHFALLNVPSDTATLIVQYLGYERLTYKLTPDKINENGQVEIALKPLTTQLEQIVVRGEDEHLMKASTGVSKVSVSPAQLAALPSLGEKDIFRSLQLLPGVSATNETSSGLYVRGGTPDQNLVLFDGFTVYHVDHFYGFFSAFNSNAVKDVQLFKGGFEAKYGGRISSVVDLTGKTGNKYELSGNVGLSALSINGSLELPFAGDKGNFFLAARRSYTDIIQSGLYDNIFGLFEEEQSTSQNTPAGRFGRFAQTQTQPAFFFYDLNAKASYRPSNRDILALSIYTGKDNLDNTRDINSNDFFGGNQGINFSNNNTDINSWGNLGTSVKWSRQWNDDLFTNTVLSYSNYFTDRDQFSETDIARQDSSFVIRNGFIENNDVRDLSLRSDLELQISKDHNLGFGIQLSHNSITYDQVQNDTLTILNRDDQGLTSAIYLQDEWWVTDKVQLNAGIRTVHFDGTDKIYLEPRLSLTYQATNRLKLKAAWGQYNQFITRVVREDVSQGSRDFWLLANEELNPVSSSTHYIAGLSYETNDFLFDIEAYYKDLSGLSEYTLRFSNSFRNRSRVIEVDELFFQGSGYARGIEFLAQKKYGKFTGWISYTLSEVIHDFPGLSDGPFPALHDQTHEFKVVNSFRLGNWNLSGTWVYSTGKPYTSPIGGYELDLLDNTTASFISVGEKNAFRLPDYHRMDLSATYSFDLGINSKAEAGLSIFNIYNRTNIWYKTFEVIEDDLITTDVTTLGFTPNIFFNFKF